jgi:hypothetical protein
MKEGRKVKAENRPGVNPARRGYNIIVKLKRQATAQIRRFFNSRTDLPAN